ncbi:zinc-binding alcohol dehydrogenase family protein [Novosphingobium sp. P6W]|uniref:quinone oxidoreductase family protein n=1 Tax=Novosphingobium sp. P6W TaxID=1609758 RepID=UPI0005C30661|nr:zinc-binding alcohol dehydrogenase family protein [Novosphingobium sp. P6W]AXB80498.1 zinc-binding alcohol dehydrogenase family protein [Novosphingobium sp. P6W]KIS29454.1 NADPH:quinone oxidoreductase [Novosphingobium sp. P6W]
MKAVFVDEKRSPQYGDFEEPQPAEGYEVVSVRAAALTNLDIMIAEGRHYFSTDRLPAVVGREAVVRTQDGQRLYLNVNAIPVPFGSMADRTLANLDFALPVPDGIDDATAAAMGNAGLAAWLPLAWRAKMKPGETVLILGATGTSGLIAVASAAALGAGRIIAAGRNRTSLDLARTLGAHETVVLDDADLIAAFRQAAGGDVDIVLDYLNGAPAEAALQVMAVGGRMVQIGNGLASGILLHAQTGRKQSLDVLGFAYYHAPIDEQRAAYRAVCELATNGQASVALETYSLEQFDTALAKHKAKSGKRLVLLP